MIQLSNLFQSNAIVLIFIIYFSFLLVIVQENYSTKKIKFSKNIMVLLSLFLISFAVFRPATLPDYSAYKLFYETEGRDRYEISMPFFKSLSPNFLVFLLYFAFIGISLKLIAIYKTSSSILLSILAYFAYSYCLHDLIQMRAGCAIGFFLYALRYLANNKKIQYIFCILIGSLFHYSILIALIFVLFNPKKYNRCFWFFFVFISYVLYLLHIDPVRILLNFIDSKSYLYLQLISLKGVTVSPFDKVNLINIFIFFLFSMKYEKQSENPMTAILLKILACSIIVIPLFASATYFSTRFRELLGSVLILLLPNALYLFKKKRYGYYLFLTIFLLYFAQKHIFSGYLLK